MFVPFQMGMPRLSFNDNHPVNPVPFNPCGPSIGIDPNPCLLRWWNQSTEDHVFGNLGGMASVEQQRSSRWLQHFSTWNCPQRFILLLIISNLSWVVPTVVTPTVKLVQSLQVSEFPATFRRFSRPSFLPQTPPAPFLKGYQSSTCVHSHRFPTSKVPVEVPLDSLAHNQQDPRNDPKHSADRIPNFPDFICQNLCQFDLWEKNSAGNLDHWNACKDSDICGNEMAHGSTVTLSPARPLLIPWRVTQTAQLSVTVLLV